MEKVGAASEEDKTIESIMEEDIKMSKDDAKTIQDKKDVLKKVLTVDFERKLEVVIDLKNEYGVSETIREAPSKLSLTFSIPVTEINSD